MAMEAVVFPEGGHIFLFRPTGIMVAMGGGEGK
jgi:hypothetical protein